MRAGSLLYCVLAALSHSAEGFPDAGVSASVKSFPRTVAMVARPPVTFVPALASYLPGITLDDLFGVSQS